MADKKLKYTDIAEKNVMSPLTKQLEVVHKITQQNTKAIKEMAAALVKASKSMPVNTHGEYKDFADQVKKTAQATEALSASEKAMIKVEKDLAKARAEDAQALANKHELLRREKKALRDNAKAIADSGDAYEVLKKNLNEASIAYKRVLADVNATPEAVEAARKNFGKLDDAMRKINTAARDGRRDVGRYHLALEGENKSVKDAIINHFKLAKAYAAAKKEHKQNVKDFGNESAEAQKSQNVLLDLQERGAGGIGRLFKTLGKGTAIIGLVMGALTPLVSEFLKFSKVRQAVDTAKAAFIGFYKAIAYNDYNMFQKSIDNVAKLYEGIRMVARETAKLAKIEPLAAFYKLKFDNDNYSFKQREAYGNNYLTYLRSAQASERAIERENLRKAEADFETSKKEDAAKQKLNDARRAYSQLIAQQMDEISTAVRDMQTNKDDGSELKLDFFIDHNEKRQDILMSRFTDTSLPLIDNAEAAGKYIKLMQKSKDQQLKALRETISNRAENYNKELEEQLLILGITDQKVIEGLKTGSLYGAPYTDLNLSDEESGMLAALVKESIKYRKELEFSQSADFEKIFKEEDTEVLMESIENLVIDEMLTTRTREVIGKMLETERDLKDMGKQLSKLKADTDKDASLFEISTSMFEKIGGEDTEFLISVYEAQKKVVELKHLQKAFDQMEEGSRDRAETLKRIQELSIEMWRSKNDTQNEIKSLSEEHDSNDRSLSAIDAGPVLDAGALRELDTLAKIDRQLSALMRRSIKVKARQKELNTEALGKGDNASFFYQSDLLNKEGLRVDVDIQNLELQKRVIEKRRDKELHELNRYLAAYELAQKEVKNAKDAGMNTDGVFEETLQRKLRFDREFDLLDEIETLERTIGKLKKVEGLELEVARAQKKVADLKSEHRDMLKEIDDRHEAKRIEKMTAAYQDFAQALDFVSNTAAQGFETRLTMIDQELDAEQSRVDTLRLLAEQGSEDADQNLALSEKRLEDNRQRREKILRTQQKVELGIAAVQAFASNSQTNPANALTKTIADITLLTTFIASLPSFEEGTENTLDIGRGMDGKGGFLSILHPNERVVPEHINRELRGLSNEELGETMRMASGAFNYNSVMVDRLERIEYKLEDKLDKLYTKPSYMGSDIDSIGKIVTKRYINGNRKTRKHSIFAHNR